MAVELVEEGVKEGRKETRRPCPDTKTGRKQAITGRKDKKGKDG
jgi:hypothetical protein